MKIGTIDLGERPVFLAPMEDVTDIAFRLMCKRFGADMVYTEFVSSEALVRSVRSTEQKLIVADEERPVGIQIYGRDEVAMADAAQICEQAHPDLIDINFGCPVKKVAGKGAGAEYSPDVGHHESCRECRQGSGYGKDASRLGCGQSDHCGFG